MQKEENLNVTGYKGAVHNSFYRQEKKTDRLAILFPGFAYSCNMPLLYYPTLLLLESGYDVLLAKTNYSRNKEFVGSKGDEQTEWMRDDAVSIVKAALKQGKYKTIVMVGKSIGTYAVAFALENVSLPKDTRTVWMTPLIKDDIILGSIKDQRNCRSLILIGTNDYCYDTQAIKDLNGVKKGMSVVINGADHSMVVYGDVFASLAAMNTILEHINRITA